MMKLPLGLRGPVIAAALCLMTVVGAGQAAAQQRPSTPELLPDETLVYVRIPSIPEMMSRFQETSTGQIFNDDRVRPLFEELYDSAAIEFEQIEDEVGLSLDEIMDLPQGEVTFALADVEGELAVAFFLDVGDQLESAEALLARGEQFAQDEGADRDSQTIGDVNLTILNGDGGEEVCYFIRDNLVCVTNDPLFSQDILARWDGGGSSERSFAENRKFVTIMNRCRTVDDEEAQFEFYVDPIEIVRVQAQQSLGGRAGFAFIPTIGLDGLLAIGGAMTLVTENYDSVMHLHVLISNPREGVMEMIAMKPGDITPEDWVPRDAIAFNTVNWDFQQTYDALEGLIDGFRGEGTTRIQIEESFNEEVGVDFYSDILEAFEGRVTIVQWMEPPVRFNSQTILVGAKLEDEDAFFDTIETMLDSTDAGNFIEDVTYEGVEYFRIPVGGPAGQPDFDDVSGQDEGPPFEFRTPSPSFAIMEGYIIFSDSEECLKAAIRASKDPEESLVSDPDFEIVADEIKKLVGTNYPGAVFYTRPAESFRFLFDMAGSDDVYNMLDRGSEESDFAGRIRDALDDNPLPDFEELEGLLAPSGGVMTNDETGIHITFFTLRGDN